MENLMVKEDILSLSKKELGCMLKGKFNLPEYRAAQIYKWLYCGDESVTFEDMNNLPLQLRGELDKHFYIKKPSLVKKLSSEIDETKKYLFEFEDGNRIESVLMKYEHGYTVCISTQAGCQMGCSFCASTLGGKARDLTPSEMLKQIMFIQADNGVRIGNVVMMGIGEPLDNFDNTLKFLELVNSEDGLNIGYRHISLSTCGLADKIDALAEKNLPVTLSVSLHAPNDRIRSQIMNVNKAYNVKRLIASCKNYVKTTKRRISFEYILINNVNDSDKEARELAFLLKGMLCHVNLIPMNEVSGKNMIYSSKEKVRQFCEILTSEGINATVRRRCGYDIHASCGQLRRGG